MYDALVIAFGWGVWVSARGKRAPRVVGRVLVADGGATAFGKRFRIYSIASIVMTLAFGALTGQYGPRIPKNLPTPWVGVWERISIAAFMFWMRCWLPLSCVPKGNRPKSALARDVIRVWAPLRGSLQRRRRHRNQVKDRDLHFHEMQ